MVNVVVQVNSKVRAVLSVASDVEQGDLESLARSDPGIGKYLGGKTVQRVVYVPGKLINFVVG